jgi:hypothetical protein
MPKRAFTIASRHTSTRLLSKRRSRLSTAYYVYTLAYPDGTVFYVGKGKNDRLKQHVTEAKRGVRSPKCDVIRQILSKGGRVKTEVVQSGLTNEEAINLEIQLIQQYGRANLTNRTNGARGPYERWLTTYNKGERETMEEQFIAQQDGSQSQESAEQYYTIKGYSDDHQRYADIRNMDGYVIEHSVGFDDDSNNDWRVLEHAKDLVERSQPGDKEEAIKLFQGIFGEKNVFVKDE